MANIFVVGDFNIDLVLYLDRLPNAGETLNARRFFEGPGGKGSNQAIAAVRLGADVTFLGAIGKDYYGNVATQAWHENGVNIKYLHQDDAYETAMALINVDLAGNNTIAVHQGANLKLTPQHVENATQAIAKSDIVMCTLGIPLAVVQKVFEIADAHNVIKILNPAPAFKLPDKTLRLVDYITPNETELSVIADIDLTNGEITDTARQLLRDDKQVMVITRGSEGAQWITQTGGGHKPALDVDVVDTVGAGDAFNAGLAVALAERKALDEAIIFANVAAALSVTKNGAVDGMPYRQDVDVLLKK
jgi:ribokinase